MENWGLVLGTLLMLLGTAVLVVAVFRTLGRTWAFGWYELWVLPVVGAALILVGRWIMQ